MKYTEKCEKLKEIIFRANGVFLQPRKGNLRWDNIDDFERYMKGIGCFLKQNRRRRAGFIVTPYLYNKICVEIPVDLAEKILVLGDIPP